LFWTTDVYPREIARGCIPELCDGRLEEIDTHCCIHEGAEANAPPQASRKMEENLNLLSLLLE
jgi:hypothetical protein